MRLQLRSLIQWVIWGVKSNSPWKSNRFHLISFDIIHNILKPRSVYLPETVELPLRDIYGPASGTGFTIHSVTRMSCHRICSRRWIKINEENNTDAIEVKLTWFHFSKVSLWTSRYPEHTELLQDNNIACELSTTLTNTINMEWTQNRDLIL